MGKAIACIIISFIIGVIYITLCKMFIYLLTLTGLKQSYARFQVFTLFTCAGYSSSESELIMYDPMRKRIALYCQIVGYIFSTIITALIICVISNLDFTGELGFKYFLRIGITLTVCIAALIGFVFLTKIPKLQNWCAKIINKFFFKRQKTETGNIILFSDKLYDKYIATVKLNKIPEVLQGLTLDQIDFQKTFDLQVLVVSKHDKEFMTKIIGDYVLQEGDQLEVFGNSKVISKLFSLE